MVICLKCSIGQVRSPFWSQKHSYCRAKRFSSTSYSFFFESCFSSMLIFVPTRTFDFWKFLKKCFIGVRMTHPHVLYLTNIHVVNTNAMEGMAFSQHAYGGGFETILLSSQNKTKFSLLRCSIYENNVDQKSKRSISSKEREREKVIL